MSLRRVGLAAAVALASSGPALARSAAAPAADPASFMAATAKAPGVVTLASGLEYRVLRSGPSGGLPPRTGDRVTVEYEGKLLDGTVFDSSAANGGPASFPVGELIPAWNEALTLMKPGDQWVLFVPPGLGYGPQGKGPIPPDSVMIFTLTLLNVQPAS